MHVSKLGVRLALLGVAVFAIMLAFGSVGQAPQHQVEAAGTQENSVSCADVYFNEGLLGGIGPGTSRFGLPPAPGGVPGGSLLLGKSMTRMDSDGTNIIDNTQVLYLGEDINGFEPVETGPGSIIDLLGFGETVPDGPPTNQLCVDKANGANTQAEPVDQLKQKAGIESQYRPADAVVFKFNKAVPDAVVDGTQSEDGAGPGTCGDGLDNGGDTLVDGADPDCPFIPGDIFSTVSCILSGEFGWLRQETYTHIANTGAKAVNYGQAALYLGTNSPPDASQVDTNGNGVPDYSNDPTACTGGTPFPSYTVNVTREATTDHTVLPPNVLQDPDGPTGTPIVLPQAPDSADGLADDWDGDGCTDWDELAPGMPATSKAGLDPFNPMDCDQDIAGVWNFFASVDKASKIEDPNGSEDPAGSPGDGTCSDTLDNDGDTAVDAADADCYMILGGTNFHCIVRLDEPTTGVLDGNLACYQDSLSLSGDSAVPSYADGISGAPPPPPYTTGEPTKAVGTWSGKEVSLQACFEELGPPLGPNLLIDASMTMGPPAIANGRLKGAVTIYAFVNNDDCDSLNLAGGLPLIAATLTGSEQAPDFDHDGDGCTDFQELGHGKTPPTVAKCGDDPYNPYDSGLTDMDGSYSVIARVARTGAAHPTAGFVPGAYFNCVAEVDHDTGDNTASATLYCYTDVVLITDGADATPGTADDEMTAISANIEDSGLVVCPPVLVGSLIDTTKCGDGNPGANPPGPAGNGTRTWGDVDTTHTVLTGTFDKATNTLVLEGCFENVENPTQGPNIYVKARLNAHVGPQTDPANNTADIWTLRADCTDPGVATPTYSGVPMLSARQSDGSVPGDKASFDTDQDGCTNAQELAFGAGTEATGGTRDPSNYWDFRDVPSGTPPERDSVVSVGDISAVVGVFGTSGDPLLDPVSTDVKGGYHTAYDTGGGIVGSAGTWNVRGPDGAISVGDITAIVNQFGHAC